MPGQTLQDIFTTGINAARDVLVARSSNDPLPNNRGANDVTAPAGSPASGFANAVMNPMSLILIAGVGLLIYFLARK